MSIVRTDRKRVYQTALNPLLRHWLNNAAPQGAAFSSHWVASYFAFDAMTQASRTPRRVFTEHSYEMIRNAKLHVLKGKPWDLSWGPAMNRIIDTDGLRATKSASIDTDCSRAAKSADTHQVPPISVANLMDVKGGLQETILCGGTMGRQIKCLIGIASRILKNENARQAI